MDNTRQLPTSSAHVDAGSPSALQTNNGQPVANAPSASDLQTLVETLRASNAELLDALHEALDALNGYDNHFDNESRKIIEAAIAKATGQQ